MTNKQGLKDINNDGKIDDVDTHLFHMGRTFKLCVAAILIIIIMAVFDRGTEAFPYIMGICGIYAGRSVGDDFSKRRREQ